jgi:redox-sensitive bicupin YhaK (pirin superfamily)
MKKSSTSIEGKNVIVGDLLVNRLIPAEHIDKVGPFLLLDHVYPFEYTQGPPFKSFMREHPHRGLVAFNYVINGEVEHFDSLGNHEIAVQGGAHWLSAGSGVIHHKRVSAHLIQTEGTIHAIHFWINIPAGGKGDPPQYKVLKPGGFPAADLAGNGGVIRVLLGKLGTLESPVESLSEAFLYRVTLNAKSEVRISTSAEMKSAVFVPDNQIIVNGDPAGASRLMVLEDESDEIVLLNPGISKADAFILGGPEPNETIFLQGPFVMNTEKEIADAYSDFFAGKYGTMPNTKKK